MEDAFRIIPILPFCYHLFGFTGASSFCYGRYPPMDCAESYRIFHLHVSSGSPSCSQELIRFMDLAHELSIQIKQEKVCLPSTFNTVHDIELDTTPSS